MLFLAAACAQPTESCSELGCLTSFEVPLGVAVVDGATLDLTVTAGTISDHCSGPLDGTALRCSTFGVEADGDYRLVGSADFEAPVAVHVVLLVDGAPALDQDLDLDWGEPDQPNGPDCPPSCYSVGGT